MEKAIAAGKLEGPAIFTSGPKLEGPKSIWPGDLEIANEKLMQNMDSDAAIASRHQNFETAAHLILNAKPLANIENTQKINGLIRKGVFLNRKALDKLLADTEQKVKTKETAEKKLAKI